MKLYQTLTINVTKFIRVQHQLLVIEKQEKTGLKFKREEEEEEGKKPTKQTQTNK